MPIDRRQKKQKRKFQRRFNKRLSRYSLSDKKQQERKCLLCKSKEVSLLPVRLKLLEWRRQLLPIAKLANVLSCDRYS
jgi:hypothetical protein